MQWKTPKNTDKYQWTAHVAEKMHYYGLSEQKVLGVIRRPQRIETCIVENTVAVMIPVGNITKGTPKPKWGRSMPVFASAEASPRQLSSEKSKEESWNQEIWVMYQVESQKSKYSKEKGLEADDDSEAKKTPLGIEHKFKNSKLQALNEKINTNKKITIISAWRYPGISPKNNPIPQEILREIEEMDLLK
jgi:hypothetical protein